MSIDPDPIRIFVICNTAGVNDTTGDSSRIWIWLVWLLTQGNEHVLVRTNLIHFVLDADARRIAGNGDEAGQHIPITLICRIDVLVEDFLYIVMTACSEQPVPIQIRNTGKLPVISVIRRSEGDDLAIEARRDRVRHIRDEIVLNHEVVELEISLMMGIELARLAVFPAKRSIFEVDASPLVEYLDSGICSLQRLLSCRLAAMFQSH